MIYIAQNCDKNTISDFILLTITHMVYRLVYRYDMIFHDRNFLSVMKTMLKSFKKLVKFNAKIILKVIFTLHIQILSMNLNSIRK